MILFMKFTVNSINVKRICVAWFIAFPLILLSVIVAKPDVPVSENENRVLTTAKDVESDFLGGRLQEGLEQYLSDQFPMRDGIKRLDVETKLRLGAHSVGGAYVAGDGRLFQKLPDSQVDSAKCVKYAARINRMAERTGIPTIVMYVPSAGVSLREDMPYGAPMYDCDALYASLAKELGAVKLIDLRGVMRNHPSYYYATDHHWTAEGAAAAYREWRIAHGQEPDETDGPKIVTVSDEFRGTLWSRVPSGMIGCEKLTAFEIPGRLTVEADGKETGLYDESALKTKDKYNYFEGGNHGILTVVNPDVKNGKTLLVLKDSFANSFLPCLVGDYGKIIMVDERYAFIDAGQLALDSGADEIAVIREMVSAG